MVRYFILVKKKTDRNWQGSIPVRAGVPLSTIRTQVRKNLKKSASAKIVTDKQLRSLARGLRSKGVKTPVRRSSKKGSRKRGLALKRARRAKMRVRRRR